MALPLMWMMSLLAVAAFCKCIKVMWTMWRKKVVLRRRRGHCEKLLNLVQGLEKSLKLMESSAKTKVLNKNQCVHLVGKLIQVSKEVWTMLSAGKDGFEMKYVFEDLCCLHEKVEMVKRTCEQEKWCHAVVLQLQNKEAFRELLCDLKCCYDCAHGMFLKCHPGVSHGSIQFDGASYEEVEEDKWVMKKRLEDHKGGVEECEIVKHMLLRLRNLERVDGGDLNDLEVLPNLEKPTIIRNIGEGSCACVFETNWLGLMSATKVLKGNRELIVSSLKEVGILAGLSHPNLVQFYGCGVDKEFGALEGDEKGEVEMWMVMEQMDMSLIDALEKITQPIPYHLAIDIMHQIAKGMHYLHDMQVAHLDLKPENVLLGPITLREFDPLRVVKLTDYGMSHLEVYSMPKSKEPTQYTIGTSGYMAPEMYKESGSPMYPLQADVWSFAMVCSMILSGTKPYVALKRKDVLKKISDKSGQGGEGLRPDLPSNFGELTDLIRECWAFDPLSRPMFFDICGRLSNMKRKFLMGIYSYKMVAQFDLCDLRRDLKVPDTCTLQVDRAKELHKEVVDESRVLPNEEVDLDTQVLKAQGFMNMSYVGIVGMGGIGKTTLARAIYNEMSIRSAYHGHCFIAQSKDYHGSHRLSCKILQDLGCRERCQDLEHAQKMMRELLATKKVLLILDDIKDENQVHDVVPLDVVHASKGTTIILTTRNWSSIKAFVREEGRFEVEALNDVAATKLFNIHLSWNDDLLTPNFVDLVKRVVEACNGLPLSLKVMGAFLQGRRKLRSWEHAVQRMKRGKSLDGNDEVWNTLRISFDGLSNEVEKRMFLDMACFFCKDVYPEGISKERALQIWAKDNTLPVRELQRLIDMSLMKVHKEGEVLDMHDHLRDMGRMIAKKEYVGTRIWNTSLIPEGGLTCKDVEKLEGISWKASLSHVCCLLKDHSCDLGKLRLLVFWSDECNLEETLHNLRLLLSIGGQSHGLKLFMVEISEEVSQALERRVKSSNIKSRSFKNAGENRSYGSALHLMNSKEISHDRVEAIEEEDCHLSKEIEVDLNWTKLVDTPNLWRTWTSLNVLHLRGCSFFGCLPTSILSTKSLLTNDMECLLTLESTLMQLAAFGSLKSLDLRRCSNLITLQKEVGNLSSLVSLNLSHCSSLTSLPEGVGNMTCLTSLSLGECLSLTSLPEGVGNLTSLTSLSLDWCLSLTSLPEGVGNLTSLTYLSLGGCSSLTSLPEGVGNMTSLTYLSLGGCSSLTSLPEGVGNLTSLTSLRLGGCLSLTSLPEGVGNLTSLTSLSLEGCSRLTSLPEGVWNLTSLTSLSLRKCSSLTSLSKGVGNLTSLTSLSLDGCSSLTSLPEGVGNLTSLTSLGLERCSSLTSLPEGVGNLTSLTSLSLGRCSSLTSLPGGLWNLTSLISLSLRGCSSLTSLPEGLWSLASLTSLSLGGYSNLTSLSEGVENLTSLTSLSLSGCSSLTSLPEGVGNLTSLTSLSIRRCSDLTSLPGGVWKLTSLTSLSLDGCSSLTSLPKGVGNLTSLTSLSLKGCSDLTSLPEGVENLTSLTSLSIGRCSDLTSLPGGLWNLTSLTSLSLQGCSSLTSLSEGLWNLTSLTSLGLYSCSSLTSLPEGVENLTSLTCLSLGGCSSLTSLSKGVGNLTSLTSLNLWECSSLTSLPEGVGNLTSLTSLNLWGCSSLTSLPEGVGNLTSLTSLSLDGCSSLTSLPEGVGNLTSLTSLSLRACSSLTSLSEGVGNLTSLTSLNLWGCSNLTPLSEGSWNFTALIYLSLDGCSSLTSLPKGVGNLTSLTSLSLKECSSLTSMPEGLWNLTSLTSLSLEGCSSLTSLAEGLENLTSLTSLGWERCSSLTSLPEGVGNLTSLTSLNLGGCSSLTSMPEGLWNLTSLTSLSLEGCSSLTSLAEGLENLTSLTSLGLERCSSLTSLPEGVGNLTSLTFLNLGGCSSLTSLPKGLWNLTSLTSLSLEGCSSLTSLAEGLENLTSLTSLGLERCSSLTSLPEGVGNLTSLTSLNLGGCSSLTSLPEGLWNLTSLTSLSLEGCSSWTSLAEGLENLTSLTSLGLERCLSLTSLPEGVGNLTSLTSLSLRGCSNLTSLPKGVGNLTSLTSLNLWGCSSLTSLPEGLWNLTSLTSLSLDGCSSLSSLLDGVGT